MVPVTCWVLDERKPAVDVRRPPAAAAARSVGHALKTLPTEPNQTEPRVETEPLQDLTVKE